MFNSVAQSVKGIFQRSAPAKASDAVVGYYISPTGKVEAIKSSMPRLRAYSGGASIVITNDTYGFAKAYAANVWAYRCAKARSKLVGKLKWRVVNRNTRREKTTHPLTIALQRNRTLIRRWEWSRCIWGETFLELLENEFEYISDLKWLNPLGMDVDTSTGFIRQFLYTSLNGGQTYRFSPNEIVFDYLDNPFDDLRGMSPLTVVLDELNIDQSQSRVVRSWFDNDARPGIIITPETPMNPVDFDRFRDTWKEQFQGPNNANKPAITTHPVKITEVQRAPSADDAVLRESIMREVCAAYEVPLSFAGAWDAATYQSAPEQRRAMYEDCVIPESDEIKGVINERVMPYFDEWGQHEFEFVLDDVMALVEDQKQKEEIAAGRLQSGGITLNEYRKSLKLNEIPTGNVFLIPSTMAQVKIDQLGQPVQPPPMGTNPFSSPQPPVQPPPRFPQLPSGKASGFDPSQPRDENGQWSETGSGGSGVLGSVIGGRQVTQDDIRRALGQTNVRPMPMPQPGTGRVPAAEQIAENNRRGAELIRRRREQEEQTSPSTPEKFREVTGMDQDDITKATGIHNIPGAKPSFRVKKDSSGNVNQIEVSMANSNAQMKRTLHFKDGKPDYIKNDYFYMGEGGTGKGQGTKIFKSQVDQAAKMGFKRIETIGGKSQFMNGYYTWPRLGYDAKAPKNPFNAERLSDLMTTPEGRDWWKKNGKQTSMSFDLSSKSRSRKVLETYYKEKFGASAGKSFALKLDDELDDAPFMSPEDEALLDRIWGEIDFSDTEDSADLPDESEEKAELAAWEKKAANKGALKALSFECYVLPAEVRSFIVRGLTSDELDAKAIKTLFSDARGLLDALKLFRATSNEWKDYFVSVVGQATNNRIDRRQLRSLMIAQLGDLGEQAYRDGLRQGGSDRTELTVDDQQALRAWLDDTTSYVDSFVDEVFSSGLSDDQIKSRADAWSNKSLSEIFTAGLASANDGAMYEFVGDDGDESCPTCTRLKGQVHPLKEWIARGYRPRVDTANFECGGWQCQHDIKPANKSEQGAW